MVMILSCMLWLLFTSILVTSLQFLRRAISIKLPPGPTPFPIIGNLLKLGDNPHRSLANLAKIHGPLMTLQLGQVTTIVISSSTIAKEILKNHDLSFCNRTIPDAIQAKHHGEFAMAWLPVSTAWRSLRKISNSYIFTSQKLDANQYLRRQKIQQLLAHVQESCDAGKAIDVSQAAFNTTLNLLSNTVFSVDLADPSSEFAREFKKLVWGIMEEAGKPNLGDYFPILRKIDLQGIRRRMGVHFGKMLEMFDNLIDQRLKQRQLHGSDQPKDMLDTLLNIIEDKSEEINRDQIKHLFIDLFAAGTDTTSSTLEWAMTELIRNPKTLSKARLELEQTIGFKGNQIEESDVSRLPYLQAIVKETLRLHSPIPLLLPHKSSSNVEICGYIVPEGTQVLVNAWAIGRDGTTWDNPDSFVPERFLGLDVDVKGRNFEVIPFGAGRRICPGLPLAMRMLYLMLGTLIHSFDWKLEGGLKPEKMDMDDKFGITLQRAQPLRAIPVAL